MLLGKVYWNYIHRRTRWKQAEVLMCCLGLDKTEERVRLGGYQKSAIFLSCFKEEQTPPEALDVRKETLSW